MPSGFAIGVIVTVRSLETAPGANETVAFPSALVIVPPVAVTTPEPAGGETPLAVFVVGSGAAASAELGADVASHDCVDDVEPLEAPSAPPDAVPAPAAVPSTGCVLGHEVTLGALPLLLVLLAGVTLLPLESPAGATVGSIVPLVPVVPLSVVEPETTVLGTVPASGVPTVVV